MEAVDFHHFLDRMRNPAAADLVRSIKSFVISFQNSPPDPDKDSRSVEDFMSNMEEKFRIHPLWSGVADEEIESAVEGLEKYLMTKLHNKAFASLPEDVERDQKISDKISLLQMFIKPEHLDIPPNFRNETSWLFAQKELQKINSYKAPRDKLVCILNCCQVINNLLLNVSIASNDHPPGADDFLPVLIYVTIKANPPQLHLNLLYIQRYRHHSKLVSEASYFYTNLVSAESFIEHLDASSVSMDKTEFEHALQEAKETLNGRKSCRQAVEPLISIENTQLNQAVATAKGETSMLVETTEIVSQIHEQSSSRHVSVGTSTAIPEKPRWKDYVATLESKGALAVLDANRTGRLAKEFPFLYANVGDLRVSDVESLLLEYKEIALRYYSLCKVVKEMSQLNTQENSFLQRNESHGVAASNDDKKIPDTSSQYEPSTNSAESDLEQEKLFHKDLKGVSEVRLDDRETTFLARDSDISDGLTIHSVTNEPQGNDISQDLIRESLDKVIQSTPNQVTSDKDSHLSDHSITDTASQNTSDQVAFDKDSHLSDPMITDTGAPRQKSLAEHFLENETLLIDI